MNSTTTRRLALRRRRRRRSGLVLGRRTTVGVMPRRLGSRGLLVNLDPVLGTVRRVLILVRLIVLTSDVYLSGVLVVVVVVRGVVITVLDLVHVTTTSGLTTRYHTSVDNADESHGEYQGSYCLSRLHVPSHFLC